VWSQENFNLPGVSAVEFFGRAAGLVLVLFIYVFFLILVLHLFVAVWECR